MIDFDELEKVLPIEAYVVSGAGQQEVNGIYLQTGHENNEAPIFRHSVQKDQLLSREKSGERYGWLLGASSRPLYGVRTEEFSCCERRWRTFKGEKPAPLVEGFSSVVDASLRFSEVLCQEAEVLSDEGKFRHAAEVYKRAGCIHLLPVARKAEIHGFRTKAFRQLAESKKKVRDGVNDANDQDEDPLHGLAAEWAIE